MASIIGDLSSMLGVNTGMVTNSTSRKGNTELNMQDFLQLMIVQLTNQTMDDSMDTSEMMNQMLQMQMITAMTNMTEVNVQSYANSLVNQHVTVGVINGNVLEERYTQVMGTGTYNGQQVIFCSDGNMYYLSQIMAVGALPDENGSYDYLKPGNGGSTGGDGGEDLEGAGGVGGADGGNDENGDDAQTGEVGGSTETEGSGDTTENPEYEGEQGVDN